MNLHNRIDFMFFSLILHLPLLTLQYILSGVWHCTYLDFKKQYAKKKRKEKKLDKFHCHITRQGFIAAKADKGSVLDEKLTCLLQSLSDPDSKNNAI